MTSRSRNDGAAKAESFVTTFNRIDRELKRATKLESHEGFKTAAHRFVEAHPWWRRDFEAMLAFSDLRNVIVHERFRRFEYLSIPSDAVLEEISAIHDRLLEPVRADEAFRREVVSVDVGTSLAELLGQVRDRAFTQFPVYEGDEFRGLITAAGIAHWLSRELDRSDVTLLDLGERTVGELLEHEEDGRNWSFAARDVAAEEIVHAFRENPKLEAVLVTEHGRRDQKPLGIATQSDAASWRRAGEPDAGD